MIAATVTKWVDDYPKSMDAALAFSTMSSVALLLRIVVAMAGSVFGEEASRGEMFARSDGISQPVSASVLSRR